MPNTSQAETFTKTVAKRMIDLEITVTELASRIGKARTTVSRTINHPTIHPRVKAAIKKELNLA